jgi:putative aldouronate transport system substrate-binding protein
MKKPVSMALCVAMIASTVLAGGCSGKTSDGTPAQSGSASSPTSDVELSPVGTFPIVKQQQTFSIMMPWSGTAPVDDSWVNKDYEKKTNVKIKWITVPNDGWKEKRSIMFASGDLPDVVAGMDTLNLTASDELQYASQGLLIPLDSMLEKDAPNLSKLMSADPSIKKLISQDDGNVYSLPCVADCYHCNYSQKMWINKTWLDKLNLKLPTTTDEYEQVLKAFKTQDPNGNGKADELPLVTCTGGWHVDLDGYLMCAFTYSDPDTKLALQDGKLIFTPTTDKYKEGLEYLHRLYKEGLISPQSFTNDEPTNTKMNVAGKEAVIGSYPFAYQNYSGDTEVWKQYVILPPLKGPDGFVTTPNYTLSRDVIRGNFAITKNAKNPELILHWVDWFYSDEGTKYRLGREGIDWRPAKQGELDFNGEQADYMVLQTPKDDQYYGNIDFTQNIPTNYSKKYRESAVAPQDYLAEGIANGTEVQLFQGTKAYEAVAPKKDQSIPPLTVAADKISDYSRMQTELFDYQKEALVKFITGDMDLDKDWDSYKAQFDKLSLQDYLQMSNEAYQNYLKR